MDEDQNNNNKKSTNTGLMVVILVILLVAGFGIYFYLRSQNLLPTQLQPTPSSPAPSAPAAVVPTSSSLITITSTSFSPQTLLIKKGTAVTWTNKDSRPHQIASDPHPQHNSLPTLLSDEPLTLNASFTYIFDKVGTFTYHDELNPVRFQGTIVVQ